MNAPPPGRIPRSGHSGLGAPAAKTRPLFEYPEPRELTPEERDMAADVLIGLPLTWIAEGR